MKALQSLDSKNDQDLHYTGPMALSQKAANEIQEKLMQLIKEATLLAAHSDTENLFCLAIDWFQFGKYPMIFIRPNLFKL